MRKYNTLFEEIETAKSIEDLKLILKQILDEVSDHQNSITRIEEDNDIETGQYW